jgi:AmmeMemoRadiSam system protein B
MSHTDTRPSPIAGTWYSSNSEQLRAEINGYIDNASLPKLKGEVIAVVAPHAGYRYSGPTAGYAFRSVLGQSFDLVAVVSPYHKFFSTPLLTSGHHAYKTPLGAVPIDQDALQALNKYLEDNTGESLTPITNDAEHSLEIELPFLQCALEDDFGLLPVMISTEEFDLAQEVGKGLAGVLHSRNTLLVASTDLSHFYSEEVANELDKEMLKQISELSPEGMMDAKDSGMGEACGLMAVIAVMTAAQELGANTAKLLHYTTSGQVSGDHQRVVGYGAVVILQE